MVDGSSNRRVKNPKTNAQTLQRVLVKAVGMLYAMLKFICNHSFEGVSNGFQCMNKFRKVNLKYLRERAATLQSSGQSLYQFYQFMPLQSDKWTPFAAIISQGHLPSVSVGIDAEGGHKAYVNAPSRTYADFVNTWGLQRGDQVTFVTVQKLGGRYEVASARILLNPRNADGSGAPMTTEIVNSAGEFPCSNWKNHLNFSTFEFDTDTSTSCWVVAATWWQQASSSVAGTGAADGSAATANWCSMRPPLAQTCAVWRRPWRAAMPPTRLTWSRSST